MSISSILDQLYEELKPSNCTLVAVSKTKPIDVIMEAYNHGQRDFGENKVQELANKYEKLPKDINWHMIGHLQSNKVKYIAPFVHLIHAVDSEKLLATINKEATKNNRTISCLLQIHIAQEESKFGFSPDDLDNFLNETDFSKYPNVRIVGLMGMATNTYDENQIAAEFAVLKSLSLKYSALNQKHDNIEMKVLSIGMSGDYKVALKLGSTMVRIGSTIFGARSYP